MRVSVYLFVIVILSFSCEDNDVPTPISKNLVGTWTLVEIYANDYWGGRTNWKRPDYSKQVRFTSDKIFYSKTTGDFLRIGTFEIISDDMLEITRDNPTNPQHPTFHKPYKIGSDGRLILSTGYTSGVISEKYKRID